MDLLQQIKQHEGLRLKPYQDSRGILTIGYGRNLEDVGISQEEAEYLLQNDIRQAREGAKTLVKNFDDLSYSRKNVLINMTFNMGLPTIRKFVHMRNAIEREDFVEASRQMLNSHWARQVGSRAEELAEQMRLG